MEEIDVDQGCDKEAEFPNCLNTMGLGPCIGIGILDTAQKKAYLAHIVCENDCEPDVWQAREKFDDWIDGIAETIDLSTYPPKVHVAGGHSEQKPIANYIRGKIESVFDVYPVYTPNSGSANTSNDYIEMTVFTHQCDVFELKMHINDDETKILNFT